MLIFNKNINICTEKQKKINIGRNKIEEKYSLLMFCFL